MEDGKDAEGQSGASEANEVGNDDEDEEDDEDGEDGLSDVTTDSEDEKDIIQSQVHKVEEHEEEVDSDYKVRSVSPTHLDRECQSDEIAGGSCSPSSAQKISENTSEGFFWI